MEMSVAVSSALRRLLAGSGITPCTISACVMLVVYRLVAGRAAIQPTTPGSEDGFIGSTKQDICVEQDHLPGFGGSRIAGANTKLRGAGLSRAL